MNEAETRIREFTDEYITFRDERLGERMKEKPFIPDPEMYGKGIYCAPVNGKACSKSTMLDDILKILYERTLEKVEGREQYVIGENPGGIPGWKLDNRAYVGLIFIAFEIGCKAAEDIKVFIDLFYAYESGSNLTKEQAKRFGGVLSKNKDCPGEKFVKLFKQYIYDGAKDCYWLGNKSRELPGYLERAVKVDGEPPFHDLNS